MSSHVLDVMLVDSKFMFLKFWTDFQISAICLCLSVKWTADSGLSYPYSCLLFTQYYTVLPVYKYIRYVSSDSAVCFSRTAHSGEWDARISIQNHEAAHQYHCQGHHFLTAEIKKCGPSNRPLPVMKIQVFWDVTTHQLVKSYQHFKGAQCFFRAR